MYYILAGAIISVCLGIEAYCGLWLYQYFCDRSVQKAEARRAATRPKIYKQVHEEWTILRNRRDVWNNLKK